MADLFESYESDLQLALQEAKTKLSQISSADPEQRKASLKAIENATDEALEVLDQMNIEVQNLPSNQRSSFNSKIRQYKNQVEQSKSQLKRLLDDQDRNELFGSRYTDGDEELGKMT
ncbi:hypothetical protein QCA50_016009 [Cerrena zonata]|uniref:Vesicle transport v-SNARE N-terminal domain-containing protein n=1 Tax=Cerrena zonata TaxID=2478898 RepID=A0AAW0FUC1_9APHY